MGAMNHMDFSGPREIHNNLINVRGVGSEGAQVTCFRTPPSKFEVQEAPNMFVALINKPRSATYKVGGKSYSRTKYAAGDLVLVPRAADWVVDFETPAESICVFLPSIALAEIIGDDAGSVERAIEPLSDASFRSPLAEIVIRRLYAEAMSGGAEGPLFSDLLLITLVSELRAMVRSGRECNDEPAPVLSDARLSELDAYLEEHIEERITIGELAALFGQPVARFVKAFKAATGMTPYQYVLNVRIDRARTLVETSRLSLSEIAYMTGFSSQAHMTELFSAKIGASPGRLRRAH